MATKRNDVEFLEGWVDALLTARAESPNVGTVAHGGRTVVYNSPSEWRQEYRTALEELNRQRRVDDGVYGRMGFSLVDFT